MWFGQVKVFLIQTKFGTTLSNYKLSQNVLHFVDITPILVVQHKNYFRFSQIFPLKIKFCPYPRRTEKRTGAIQQLLKETVRSTQCSHLLSCSKVTKMDTKHVVLFSLYLTLLFGHAITVTNLTVICTMEDWLVNFTREHFF